MTSSPRVRHWSQLTAPEIRKAASSAVAILPIAATEQHGPHLATGTDVFLNELLQRELVATPPAQGDFLVLPTLCVGASDHHVRFGGTLTLPPLLYTNVLVVLLRTLITQGHRRIFVLNSHGGNAAPLATALAQIAAECTEKNILVGGASYWEFCEEAWKKEIPSLKLKRMGHACEIETSMLAVARPDLTPGPAPKSVNYPDFLAEGWNMAVTFQALTEEGHIGHPAAASRAKGEALLAVAARELRLFFAAFAERPLPHG